MKSLNTYISEGLADQGDDNVLNKNISQSLIIDWLKANVKSIRENKLNFDFNTDPITINYNGNIQFKKHITSLTNEMFQWGEVRGYFGCEHCKSLKTLEGAPKKVEKHFDCNNCISITLLKGVPQEVGGYFDCSNCVLLKSLDGAPKEVGGSFDCSDCKSLNSLEGAPKEVESFDCSDCHKLTSLKGAPGKVGENFYCHNCISLKTLEGAPKEVGENFYCHNCGGQFTEDDVKKVSNVKNRIICKHGNW